MSSLKSEEGGTSAKRRKKKEGTGESEGGGASSGGCDPRCESISGEETGDPFLREGIFAEEGFVERARHTPGEGWLQACQKLMGEVRESMEDIRLADEDSDVDVDEAYIRLRKSYCALWEYDRRYRRTRRLAEGRKRVERERDELCTSLAMREEELKHLAEEKEEGERKLRSALAARVQELTKLNEEKEEGERQRDKLQSALAASAQELTGLIEEKQEAERERDRLRAALASREEERGEEGRTPPPIGI